jgi:hypothetical protein
VDVIEDLRQRFLAARATFRDIPVGGEERFGAPDPANGERWNRGNILGHMADILHFWPDQLQGALDGATWIGRGEEGYANRRAAIVRGAETAETLMREQIERGTDKVLALLDRVRSDDLSKEVEHRRAVETKSKTIARLLDEMLVSHFEAHVRQLGELSY